MKKTRTRKTAPAPPPAPAADEQRLLTPGQVGRALQVDRGTVARWVNAGRIPGHRTAGGHRRISLAALRTFAAETGQPLREDVLREVLS
jgi:excisionase family DNA binding protein